jgi:ABC-type phosphate transport system substrate-binding protein
MTFRHRAASLAAALALATALATGTAHAATLAGSDLLKGACADVLKNETAAAAPIIALDGSLMGEKFLRDKRADAALLFIPDKPKKKPLPGEQPRPAPPFSVADKVNVPEIAAGEWIAVPIAFQTIVVVVHKDNTVDHLDLDTLAAIFGRQQRIETLRNWSTIPGSNLKLPLHPLVTRYELSVATPMFRNRVLRDQDFRTTTSFFTSDAQSLEYLAGSPQSIGILAVPPTVNTVRIVALAASGNPEDAANTADDAGAYALAPGSNRNTTTANATPHTAYLPTPENLHNGDYPLAVPLYLVIPKKNLPALRPLLPALLGDAFADALLKAGFVPIAKNFRKNLQQTLDNAR